MAAKKTQCPFCESIFAVTPEQLSARGGHVRCGKCFQVFKADQHLVASTLLGAPASTASPRMDEDIFALLDQPTPHDDESDTLAGQSALPALDVQHLDLQRSGTQHVPVDAAKPSHLGKLEQENDLESDFDALFTSLTPQPIDLNDSYAQSAQSKLTGTQAVLERSTAPAADTRQRTPAPAVPSNPTPRPQPAARAVSALNLPSLANITASDDHNTQRTAQFQDTPPPGSIPAVVPPPLGVASSQIGASAFNKKQQTSAKLSSLKLKLDDELSELFLGDTGHSPQKDLLKRRDTLNVNKLSSTADESWADALLNEEENAKKLAAEQQAAAVLGSQKPPSVLKPNEPARPAAAAIPATHKSERFDPPPANRSMAIEEDDLLSYLSQVGATSQNTEERAISQDIKRATQALPPPASHRVKIPVKPTRSTGHYLAWGLLCLFMLLLLLVQVAYFNFSNLAVNPRYNAKLTAVCAVIGCQVPSMDLSKITTSRIKLQRNPTDRSTTRVTLRLTNEANRSQLMPNLKFLQLDQGNTVAYRVVQPHEYLQGNDRQFKQLLPRQSLTVEFTLNAKRADIKTYAIDPIY